MNILLFCSNPVNGGTARIFYELAISMGQMIGPEDKLTACVNENNPVEIYKRIGHIERLPVYSEEEICPGMYGGSTIKRLLNRMRRKIRCWGIKKRNIAAMQEYLKKNQIDTILIHNGGYVGDDLCNQMLSAAYRCSRQVLHRIYVLHNDMEKNVYSKLRFWAYDRKISREATEIVTVSQFTKNRICRSSFISRDIKVVYNGIIDMHTLSENEKQEALHIDPENFNVLMIGNFMENKGQHKFIETAMELCKRGDTPYYFVIIGNVYDDAYFRRCKEMIARLGMEKRFSIYQGINHASEFIDMFDILAVPSMYDESFGLISVEAMANCRPVVAFACGGIPEVVVDGRDGFVVLVGDAMLMAEKIEWLALHTNERRIMGDYCREDYIKKFSVESMTKRYLELVKKQ